MCARGRVDRSIGERVYTRGALSRERPARVLYAFYSIVRNGKKGGRNEANSFIRCPSLSLFSRVFRACEGRKKIPRRAAHRNK